MGSVTLSNIVVERTPVQKIDRRPTGRLESPKSESRPSLGVSLVQYHPDFTYVIGPDPTHSLLLSSSETSRNPFFHEACIYLPEHEELYVTSNILQSSSSSQLPVILISKLKLRRGGGGPDAAVEQVEWSKLRPPSNMPMPSSGAAFSDGMLFCSQGTLAPGSGGLFYMPRGRPPQAVVTEFFGRDFNSLHDVALRHHPPDDPAGDGAGRGAERGRRRRSGSSGGGGGGGSDAGGGGGGGVSFWFTDPCHGFEQDFRKKPQLPCHVYRFDPETGDLRVVADGLGRPTGLCFAPDGATLYVTDSDAVHGDGNQDATRPASIYAFDVLQRAGADFLANKRIFAYALRGIPMGVKCDGEGNVYAGCADGVEVWSPGGTLLGVIEVQGGVTNFCFAKEGEMFLCAEQKLWRVFFKPDGEGRKWKNPTASMEVNPEEHNFI